MGLHKKDYILNLIEQLSRILTELHALITGGRPALALVQIEELKTSIVGPLGPKLDRMNAASLVALLGHDKSVLYAELSRIEAEAHRALGDERAATRARARADDIASRC